MKELLRELAISTGAKTLEQVMETAVDVYRYIVAHQERGERVGLLNRSQQRFMQRYDKVGILYLPSYIAKKKENNAS